MSKPKKNVCKHQWEPVAISDHWVVQDCGKCYKRRNIKRDVSKPTFREIKLRAWDKKNKDMFNVQGFDMYEVQNDDKEYDVRGKDDIILMQFTGLKDKKGQEIYEGDILHVKDCGFDFMGIVEWSKRVCSFEIYDKFSYKPKQIGYGKRYQFDDTTNFEIIGNIYENPELLNDKV